jgi:4-azaleucine resistance transporter AzlC
VENPSFLKGVKSAIPIVIGFVPVAITFGILSKNTGLLFGEAAGMSLIVFAGASQFMALNLIAEGSVFLEIVIATFLLNFRHILMSASLSPKLTGVPKWRMRGIAFWITDESFAVASSLPGQLSGAFLFGLQITTYIAWATGTIIGYLAGTALPTNLQDAMSIALYALFTALLIGRAKVQKSLLVPALLAGALNLIFCKVLHIPVGWSFVLAMLISAVACVVCGFEIKEETRDAA